MNKTGKNKLIDLTGLKFNNLTVLRIAGSGSDKKGARFWCQCDCGNTTIVRGASIRTGNTKSCGCLKKIQMDKVRSGMYKQRFDW